MAIVAQAPIRSSFNFDVHKTFVDGFGNGEELVVIGENNQVLLEIKRDNVTGVIEIKLREGNRYYIDTGE